MFVALMTFIIQSCTTTKTITKEVPVEVPIIHHDTVKVKSQAAITWKIKDSIVNNRDTVFFFHREVIDNSTHDTLYLARSDSASKPVYISKTTEVSKPPNILKVILYTIAGIIILLSTFAVLIFILRYKIKS
jgi:hypothetical protein